MIIRIEPSLAMFDSKVAVRPMLPGDIYIYNVISRELFNAHTGTLLPHHMDNRGMHWRLLSIIDEATGNYMDHNGVRYILISCPESKFVPEEVANNIIVYDAISEDGGRINPNRVSSLFANLSDDLVTPPLKVMMPSKVISLYDANDKLVFWMSQKIPRPVLVFPYDKSGSNLVYGMLDPFVQWSPSRYMVDNPFTDIPRDISAWVRSLLNDFNWDYFVQMMVPVKGKTIDVEYFVASIFDILYDEYIYYGVCSKLWPRHKDTSLSKDNIEMAHLLKVLRGPSTGEQTIVNFTDIVDTIYQFLRIEVLERLSIDDKSIDKDSMTIEWDSDSAAEKIYRYIND